MKTKKSLYLKYKRMKVDFVLESFFTDLQNQIYNSDLVLLDAAHLH